VDTKQIGVKSQKFTSGEIIIEIWIFRQKADFFPRPGLEGVFTKNCNAAGVREIRFKMLLMVVVLPAPFGPR